MYLEGAGKAVITILIGAVILFAGNSLLITVLPLRAGLEGFSETIIGMMGTVHFFGFALGCTLGPAMVRRVGHIRCFAGFGALMASLTLIFPSWVDPIGWSVLRGLGGVCVAMLYLVVESWLNDSASNAVRGAVLSIYIIVTNMATIGGQLSVNLFDVAAFEQFSMVAILIAMAVVPLCLATTQAPKPVPAAKLRIGRLWSLSQTGFVACIAVGMIEGSFWTLGPVFASAQGLSTAEITLFMSAFVVGGLVSQWPLGRLSDKVDRRWILLLCCAGTTATALILTTVEISDGWVSLALAVAHGCFMLPLYPLSLAHANDYAPNEELVEVSSGLLLLFAVGAITGPWTVGAMMDFYDDSALFYAMAVLLVALGVFIISRIGIRPSQTVAAIRAKFVPVPKTSQGVYTLEADD